MIKGTGEKLLGIKFDSKLSFGNHTSSHCMMASQKSHALIKIVNYMKTFVISQFYYCLLVWMFHSRKLNHHINAIYERAPRVTYRL